MVDIVTMSLSGDLTNGHSFSNEHLFHVNPTHSWFELATFILPDTRKAEERIEDDYDDDDDT